MGADMELVRTTPIFDAETVPPGLLRAHRIAAGVWGRVVVEAGRLEFVFEDESRGTTTLSAGDSLTIPPSTPHHVVLDESVTFYIEFYRPRR